MNEPFNWEDIIEEYVNNLTSRRLVEFGEVDIEGHCLVCEQGLDEYHLKECDYAGCSLCGRKDCICDG